MYCRVVDGKAELATHIIKTIKPPDDIQPETACYSQSEVDQFVDRLRSRNIDYAVESVTWTQDIIDKANSKKYVTRSEAIEDFQGMAPITDSERVVLLEKQLAETQNAVNLLLGL